MTSQVFPKTQQLAKDIKLPLACILQPLAQLDNLELQTTKFYNNNILRCDQCRTYINPFCKFVDNGTLWQCNLCNKLDKVPQYYYCQFNQEGERQDKYSRPELNLGSYEIVLGQDYMTRPPVPPTFFFIVDVSQSSIQNGALQIFANVLKEQIQNNQFKERDQIGIITYDSAVHFYKIKNDMKQPQVVVWNDFSDDLIIPIPDDLLLNIKENKDQILQLLDSLTNMWQNNKTNQSCLQQVICYTKKIIQHIGAKVILIQSSPMVALEPSLQMKKQSQSQQIDFKSYLIPSSPFFANKAAEMHQYFISFTQFIFSGSYKNALTLAELTRYLNGEFYYYPETSEIQNKFYYDLKEVLTKEYTWESVFRIRISQGWRVTNIGGNYSIKSTDLLSYTNVSENNSLLYEFEIMENAQNNQVFSIQTALLYTTQNGERRMRCNNYSIPLSQNINEIYENVDNQTLTVIIFRQTLQQIYRNPNIQEHRSIIYNKLKDIIRQSTNLKLYQETNGVPESCLQLPQGILGILKHKILSIQYTNNFETDYINHLRILLNSLSVDETYLHLVPYLFQLHTMIEDQAGIYDQDNNFIYPQVLNSSVQSLDRTGVYLLDNGVNLIMFIGGEVSQKVLKSLFGSNFNQVEQYTEENLYYNQQDSLNERVNNLIIILRQRKHNKYAPLYIIVEGSQLPQELEFFQGLIEDKSDNFKTGYNISYNEFIKMILA